MPERYRFSLPDGRTHESDAGLAAIRKAHPDATITHHVVLDDDGKFVRTEPFHGKSAEPKAAKAEGDEPASAPASVEVKPAPAVVITESKAAPAKSAGKKGD